MNLQLIRSATLRISYAGHLFIIDPCLGAQYAYEPLVGKSRNPMADLPYPAEEVIEGAEMVIVSHLHRDHWDLKAQEIVPKDMSLYCQPGNEEAIRSKGFIQVQPIEDRLDWQGIQIIRTPGQHGTGVWAEQMGKVSGFIFRAVGEPTVYWTGDTIWYEPVAEMIQKHAPNIIITHSCGAEFEAGQPIVMDAVQTVAVCQFAPNAKVVAVHLDAYDHSTISRVDLRAYAEAQSISQQQLLIPDDGETLVF